MYIVYISKEKVYANIIEDVGWTGYENKKRSLVIKLNDMQTK